MKSSASSVYRFLANHLINDVRYRDRRIYFVTVHVRTARHWGANPSRVLSEFDRPYRRLLRKLLGQNYHRKPKLQPRVIAAFDREGTRHNETRPDRFNATPHIHALISFRPSTVQKLTDADIEGLLIDLFQSSTYFEDPDVRRVDASASQLRRLVSYVLKDARYLEASAISENFAYDLWPRSSANTLPTERFLNPVSLREIG